MTRVSRALLRANSRRRAHLCRSQMFEHKTIVALNLIFDLLCNIFLAYLIWRLFVGNLQIFLENLSSWVLLATVNVIADISSTLYLIANWTYGFVIVVLELTQATVLSLVSITTWSSQLLKSITITCFAQFAAVFAFLDNIIPFSIIMGITTVLLGLRIWKLTRTIAEISKVQEILKSNFEKAETQLKNEKQQHNATLSEIKKLTMASEVKDWQNSTLESQKSKSNLKIEELFSRNKELQRNKLQLKFQKEKLELSMKKAEKENEQLVADIKQNLKSQIKELDMKLTKAEKQNLMLGEDTLRMQSKNQNLNLQLEKEKDEKLCVICTDKEKKILLQPCNHLCLCEKCLLHQKWTECPVCRQHITSTIDIYV